MKRIDELIFGRPGDGFVSKTLSWVLIIFLFLGGIVHWTLFFNSGEMSFNGYDWTRQLMYHSVLRQSIQNHVIPYHVSKASRGTNRFLAVPEIPLSPQVLLLPLMSTGKFVLLNTLILYSIGFMGCLLIRKKYRLSFLPFLILYLLFNFNGHIISHIAVGHMMWSGYFLLPFFCMFVLDLIEKKSTSIATKLSFLLLAIILQGGFHMYVWCLMFILLLIMFNKKLIRGGLLTILFSLLLSAFRLLPAAITYWGRKLPFMSGYPTLGDLLAGLTCIRASTYKEIGGIYGILHWWEYDIYVSIIGLAVLVYFGVYLRFSKKLHLTNYKYQALDIPILLMILFSLGNTYALISNLPIPLLSSERVSSRFLIIPTLFLLVISSIRMQQLLPEFRSVKLKFLAIFVIVQMAFLLGIHSGVWEIPVLEKLVETEIVPFPANIINQQDILYKMGVKISAVISLISFVVLLLKNRDRSHFFK